MMQEYVQKSTSTTLPLNCVRLRGRSPGVLSQATMPVKFAAGPRSGNATVLNDAVFFTGAGPLAAAAFACFLA